MIGEALTRLNIPEKKAAKCAEVLVPDLPLTTRSIIIPITPGGTAMPPHFRLMSDDDAEAVSALIHRTFQNFIADTYTARGIKHFLRNTSKRAMMRRKRKNQLIFVAEADDKISGMIAVRKGNHITLLFVAPEFHGRGIGALLFQEAFNGMKAAIPDLGTVTVNSSDFALPFYTKLGFAVRRPAHLHRGMKITPMELLP